ncbi:MAG: hypothetical protein M5U22_06655 [Thermoleophilia bacterium]|nr:hypothetical protein [Thermoleophilia bacterium]
MLTVLFIPDEGQPSAAAALFQVSGSSSSTTTPTVTQPPFSEATMPAAHQSVNELLRSVRDDDLAAFTGLYAETDRIAGERWSCVKEDGPRRVAYPLRQ